MTAYRWLACGLAVYGLGMLVAAATMDARPSAEFMLALVGGIALGSAVAVYVVARRYGQ